MRILILVILLSGCGVVREMRHLDPESLAIADKAQTRNDMLSSKDIYKTCLAAGGECINEKLAYDADLAAFSATSDGIRVVGDGIRVKID